MKKKYYYSAVYFYNWANKNSFVDGEIELDTESSNIERITLIKEKVFKENSSRGCGSAASVKVLAIIP